MLRVESLQNRQKDKRIEAPTPPMVKNFHFALLALALAGAGMAERAIAADPAQTVHGSADVYAAPGIALAWGILRGASETTTIVVVRVTADAQAFGSLEVVGVDPFTQKTERRLVPTALKDTVDVKVPRAQFADFPRTELRFFASASPSASDAPKLVVYYLGIPDTTPEFPTDAALEKYLAARLNSARESQGSKKP